MPAAEAHPAERFVAPSSIQRGVPLKALLDRKLVRLIGASMAQAHGAFDQRRFSRNALNGLDELGLMPRAAHIAKALGQELPEDTDTAAALLIAAMGPELVGTSRFGLAVFFYLPHVAFIRTHLVDSFAAGMRANRAVTTRFSAEYSIRPYLLRYPEPCLALLAEWARDANPHVRRLVSEGSRPRLPWAERLRPFMVDPTPTLRLLELLKDDPSDYVRRSVANHLGDIAKDHPTIAFAVCRRWLDEVGSAPAALAKARRALIRHAVRLPAQHGVAAAVRLRRDAGSRG